MNSIIKTIGDIHPEEYYVTSEQYKTIKNKKINVPFEIKDGKRLNVGRLE